MLSDRQLLMKHRRMELILIIGANYKNWTVKERGKFSKKIFIYRKAKLELPRLESEEAIGQCLEPSKIRHF